MSKLSLKNVAVSDPQLSGVIKYSIGDPTKDKILNVIKNYNCTDSKLIGAFLDGRIIGVIGLLLSKEQITIRHISILPKFQQQGIGTQLLNYVKRFYDGYELILETDEETLGFYLKSGFSCHRFQGKSGNWRYKCKFINIA